MAQRSSSTSPTISRFRFLALAGIGGMAAFGAIKLGIGSQKGWRTNTVESQVPAFEPASYTLTVDGLVAQPFTVNYQELRALPRVRQVSDFHCVEGWGVDDVQWDGVRLQTIIERAQPTAEAKFVTFHSMRGIYRDQLTMAQAQLPDALIAYLMDGQPLPPDRGAPLRVVMPRMFGYKGAKWLRRIEFTDQQDNGYWEQRGWQVDAWING